MKMVIFLVAAVAALNASISTTEAAEISRNHISPLATDWAAVAQLVQNIQSAVTSTASSVTSIGNGDNASAGRTIERIMNTMDQGSQKILSGTLLLAQAQTLYLQIFDAHHKRLLTVISDAEYDLRTPLNSLSSGARTDIRNALTQMKTQIELDARVIILQVPVNPIG